MSLTPESVAALRGLAADVAALNVEGAHRHPAYSASADLIADRVEACASDAPPFHQVALRRIGDAMRASAEAREAGDIERVISTRRAAADLARHLVHALDRYSDVAPTATPATCTRCGEPYVAYLIPRQRSHLSRIDAPVSGHVYNSGGATYIVEQHVLCAFQGLADLKDSADEFDTPSEPDDLNAPG